LFTTLVQPERADTLDFSGFLPVVRVNTTRDAEDVLLHRPSALAPARASAPVAAARRERRQPLGRRIVQASVRLADLGAVRPIVYIPGRGARKNAVGQAETRHAKLPPVWLLANVLILVVATITVLPRILTADAAAGCSWHVVVPGDTLGNLGWTYHSNALALASANHIANPNLIYVGQRLCIPTTQDAHTAQAPAVPAAQQPPTYGSAKGVKAFIDFALPYARRAHDATGWPVSMILAQWGLEQGWRIPGYTGFNFGNVAALPGEPTVNGIAVPGSPAAFAYAHTPEDGLRYYLHVARLSYYSKVAAAAASGGPNAAAQALGASPWDAAHYTSIGSPGSSLLSLMRTYNLYSYDSN